MLNSDCLNKQGEVIEEQEEKQEQQFEVINEEEKKMAQVFESLISPKRGNNIQMFNNTLMRKISSQSG